MADLDYRPMGFETDVANQNFVGAQNPDELLHVEFYWHEPEDPNQTQVASEKAGRYIKVKGPRQIYILIMAGGDKTSEIRRAKRLPDEHRFAKRWLQFQIQEGLVDYGESQPGWKIEEWDQLTQEEVHQLKFLRFYTVEQIAGASDAQIGSVMGGLGLRKRAYDACKARATLAVRAELDAKDKELTDLKERMAKMEAMLTTPVAGERPREPEAQPPRRKFTMTPEHKAKMAAGRAAAKAAREAKT